MFVKTPLVDLVKGMAVNSTVVDVGFLGWAMPRLAVEIGRGDILHVGVDVYGEPSGRPSRRPSGTEFIAIGRDGDRFGCRFADLVVSSHCLEHSVRPIDSFEALVHAAKVGGLIYVEAPSEISAMALASDDAQDHAFSSFWDDPTHVRPWTPGALYRLALGYGAVPIRCGRLVRGGIPCAGMVCRVRENQDFRYVTLKDVEPGVRAAFAAIWPEHPKQP